MNAAASRRSVATWLFVCAGFVVAMVVVGGVTRLTRSGLSIVEWQPITGTLPPLSHADWLLEYQKYQQSPEGRLLWTPRGAETNLWGHVHSWDIEAAAYAGLFAVRVGVSPGELVDFVLGWFGVDIARDDRRHRERVADPDA